jgi:hypothetical protein
MDSIKTFTQAHAAIGDMCFELAVIVVVVLVVASLFASAWGTTTTVPTSDSEYKETEP